MRLGKKKQTLTLVEPQELSAQNVKLLMTLQIVFLHLEPKMKAYRPFAEAFLGFPLTPETVISLLSRQRSDSNTTRLLDSLNRIIKAVSDAQVSPDNFEDVLLSETETIKELNKEEQTA